MKSKEEIEQLANERYLQRAEAITDSTIKGYIVSATKGGFVDGYTQCQENMQKLMDDYQTWIFTTTEPLKSFKQWLDN